MINLKELLASNIKHLRSKAGLSQTELAKKIFCSRNKIAKIENESVVPSIDIILALANEFKVSISDIVTIGLVSSNWLNEEEPKNTILSWR